MKFFLLLIHGGELEDIAINILLKYQSDINKALKELATADGVTP